MRQTRKRVGSPAYLYTLLYVAALLLAPARLPAAEADDRLKIPFAPEIGVARHFEITRSRQRSDGRGLARILEVRSRARLTPLERNPAGYLYRFEITETEATAPGSTKPGLDRLLSRLAALITGVPLVYQADSSGAPRRLVNAREVRQAFRGMLSELQGLVRRLTQAGVISPVERANVEANVRDILGTLASLPEEELGRSVLKEVALLFAAGGHGLAIGRFEAFAPHLGPRAAGRVMDAEARRGVTSIDAVKRQAVVEVRVVYDQAQIGAAVARLTERLAGNGGEQHEGASDPPEAESFRVTESGRYLIDLRDGQPIALHHRRTTAVGAQRLVEVTRIGRIRP
ncbi:MAG: hypothetical protein QNJ30_16430 [Kiloniellales bacterium]|nr:hypothetical protein [Kiloniellales bacterium]